MIGKVEKKVLKDIYKASNGLLDYTLHLRFSMSAKKAIETIRKFESLDYVTYDGARIKITKKGKEYIIKNNISSPDKFGKLDKIPENFCRDKLDINEFYIPDTSILDNELKD